MNVQNHNRQVGCGKNATFGLIVSYGVVMVVESCAMPTIGKTENT